MLGGSSTNQEYSQHGFLTPWANVKQVLGQGIEQETKKGFLICWPILDRTPFNSYLLVCDLLSFLLAQVKTDSIFSGHPVESVDCDGNIMY